MKLKTALLLILTTYTTISFAMQPNVKWPFSCSLEYKIGAYDSFRFEGLLDLKHRTLNYFSNERDKDGNHLFSENGTQTYTSLGSQLLFKLNNGSVVSVSSDILTSTQVVDGMYAGRSLLCQALEVTLEAKLPSFAFDKFNVPSDTELIGNVKRKKWTSSDGKLELLIEWYPASPATSGFRGYEAHTNVEFAIFGNVSGRTSDDVVNFGYVFYNPNRREEQRRVVEAVLENPADISALKNILKPHLASKIAVFDTFYMHTSPVRFSIDCSQTIKCVLRAEN